MARTKHGLPGIYNSSPITLSNEDGSALAVNSAGVLQVASGTGASDLGKAEDTIANDGDTGIAILERRIDAPASSAGTSGDYAFANQDALGHKWMREGYVDQYIDNATAVAATVTKPLAVSTYSYTKFQNLGANATLNVKATPGNVYSVQMSNVSGGIRYLQIHNIATTPAGAAVPFWTSSAIPAGGSILIDSSYFGPGGMNLSTGIAFSCSTTEATYTAATATDHITHVWYK